MNQLQLGHPLYESIPNLSQRALSFNGGDVILAGSWPEVPKGEISKGAPVISALKQLFLGTFYKRSLQ